MSEPQAALSAGRRFELGSFWCELLVIAGVFSKDELLRLGREMKASMDHKAYLNFWGQHRSCPSDLGVRLLFPEAESSEGDYRSLEQHPGSNSWILEKEWYCPGVKFDSSYALIRLTPKEAESAH